MNVRTRAVTVAKLVIAVVAVSLLITVPARRVAPTLSYIELLGLVLLALLLLLGATLATLYLAQFVLRQGGTDTQWFWFAGEPPGLQKLREQEREERQKPVQ